MKTFSDLMALWGARRIFAEDIGAPLSSVNKWAFRNSIPGKWDSRIVSAARRRRLSGVTFAALAALRAEDIEDADSAA